MPEFKESSLDWNPCFTMHPACTVAGLEKNLNPANRYHGIYFEREIEAEIYVQFRRARNGNRVQYRIRTEQDNAR